MTVVSALNTGRSGFDVTITRESDNSRWRVQWATVADAREWTRSRNGVLYLAAYSLGYSDAEAQRMARASLVLWANESGWGGHEYRWNGWGSHCFSGGDCMHFTSGDPELAAFADLGVSASAFWREVRQHREAEEAFKRGDETAASVLVATDFGGGAHLAEADARSIYQRVSQYLEAAGSIVSSREVRRRRSSTGFLWLAGAAAALAAMSKKG